MTTILTAYILMWPVLVTGVLVTLAWGFLRDLRQARKDGQSII